MDSTKIIIKNDKLLNEIMPILKDYDTYLVGGYVRDAFLHKTTHDRDIVAFNTSSYELARKIQETIQGFFVELDNENQIYRVISPNKIDYIDIAQGVGNSIEQDLKRRDFTINAIAIRLKDLEIIDITGGINDLENKKINLISEQNLVDDALRIIRAARFQAKFNFDLDDKFFTFATRHINLLDNIAKERINYELMKIFEGQYSNSGLLSLDRLGLIDKYFSCMIDVKKIPPNSHHHLPLFQHCLETIHQIQIAVDNADEQIKNYFNEKNLGVHTRLAYLKLAAFLHDIGKPKTWTIEPDSGRHRFIKHDDVGSQIVIDILKNLKFSNKQIKYIQQLIKYHIYPSALMSEEVNEKALNRYFRKMDTCALDIIFLAKGDRLSARGKEITQKMVDDNIAHLNNMTNFYFNIFLNQKPLPKLLDGYEVMNILNIPKSPQLGKIIKLLQEEQINSEVITKDDAINFIKNIDLTSL